MQCVFSGDCDRRVHSFLPPLPGDFSSFFNYFPYSVIVFDIVSTALCLFRLRLTLCACHVTLPCHGITPPSHHMKMFDYNSSILPFNREGVDNLTVIFPSADKRASFETTLIEAKQKLAQTIDRRPPPEFLYPLPIRKTRAGLQFTCASPTLGLNSYGYKDVWVCNSDGYVGQVCVLSLQPDANVTSCNGVCNARILCVAAIPPFM